MWVKQLNLKFIRNLTLILDIYGYKNVFVVANRILKSRFLLCRNWVFKTQDLRGHFKTSQQVQSGVSKTWVLFRYWDAIFLNPFKSWLTYYIDPLTLLLCKFPPNLQIWNSFPHPFSQKPNKRTTDLPISGPSYSKSSKIIHRKDPNKYNTAQTQRNLTNPELHDSKWKNEKKANSFT